MASHLPQYTCLQRGGTDLTRGGTDVTRGGTELTRAEALSLRGVGNCLNSIGYTKPMESLERMRGWALLCHMELTIVRRSAFETAISDSCLISLPVRME